MTVYKNVLGSQNGGDGDHRGKRCFWESFSLIVFMWPQHLGLKAFLLHPADRHTLTYAEWLYIRLNTGKYYNTEKRERASVKNLPLQLGLWVKALETTLIMALVLLLCVITAVIEALIDGRWTDSGQRRSDILSTDDIFWQCFYLSKGKR